MVLEENGKMFEKLDTNNISGLPHLSILKLVMKNLFCCDFKIGLSRCVCVPGIALHAYCIVLYFL